MTYTLSGSYGSFPGPGDLWGAPDDPAPSCDGDGIVVGSAAPSACPECGAVLEPVQDPDGAWLLPVHDRGEGEHDFSPDPPDYDLDGPWV